MPSTRARSLLLQFLLVLYASALIPSCGAADATQVRVIAIHPHNTSAFTEGLLIDGDALLESTGLNHKSFIREYPLPRSRDAAAVAHAAPPSATQECALDAAIFGEGIAVLGDKLYALTYRAGKILEFSRDNLKLLGDSPLDTSTGEGWGMTTDGEFLVVSDGSALLQFFDPRNAFALHRSVTVHTVAGEPVDNVNELEFVEGEVLANVWFRNVVLRIDPADGAVIEEMDFSWMPSLVSNLHTEPMISDPRWRREAVMNGIAYDRASGHVYVTGKLWDSLFELELSYLDRHRLPAGYH